MRKIRFSFMKSIPNPIVLGFHVSENVIVGAMNMTVHPCYDRLKTQKLHFSLKKSKKMTYSVFFENE